MNNRRGFFAFIGNAAVTGLVATRASAAKPTLILPPSGIIEPAAMPAGAHPLLSAHKSEMHAILAIRMGVPEPLYFDWMEIGLRRLEGCKPSGMIYRAIQADLADGLDPWRAGP